MNLRRLITSASLAALLVLSVAAQSQFHRAEQDFYFGGQARVLAQQPRRMRKRHLERSNGLRCPGHDSRPWRSPVPHGDTRLHVLR